MAARLLYFLLSAAALAAVISAASRRSFAKQPGHPVILIPGDAGSQLLANLTGKPSVVHYTCYKQTADFFDLWLDLRLFAPIEIDCWVDNMKLVYNSTSGTSSNMPGVDIRVPDFGGTSSIEWLDKSNASQGRYFFDIVNALDGWGYSRGKDILGAPYDWRKAPNEHSEYYQHLKSLVQATYRYNNNKKIVFVAHSMGNPTLYYFLQNIVDEDWKAKYVKSFVSIGAPWGGSMQIVRLFASGYNMNYYRVLLPPSKLREMQRSFTSSALLFPSSAAWATDAPLATTSTKNYTVSNVQEFFTDIKYELGWQQYQKGGPPIFRNMKPLDVPMHCIYGTSVQTPARFDWSDGYFPDYPPNVVMGDGDGTVNINSAEVCLRWKQQNIARNGPIITTHMIKGAEHMAIMKRPEMIEIVRKAIYDEI